VVCSAETSLLRTDLRAYVLRLNGAAFDLVAEAPLDYSRGCATLPASICFPAEWQPWRDTVASVCPTNAPCDALAYDKQIIYPQPLLSDIEFDSDGSLILGLMDRASNQWGNANYAPTTAGTPITIDLINATGSVSETLTAAASTDLFEGTAAGDILRMCPDGSGGFDLENNATCGGTTTGGANGVPAQGPGGGEFYWQDMYQLGARDDGGHQEITLGGLKLVPGRTEIGAPVFDPNDDYRAGGIAWLSNTTGLRTRSYEVFGLDSAGSMGKAGGLGDLEALCDDAPIEIGNRVWVDSDANGIQDPDEASLSGVTVNLYNQSGTQIGTTTTDADGEYYFGGVTDRNLAGGQSLTPNTAYSIRVPLTQTAITSGGYTLTTANASGNTRDAVDSDATVSGSDAVINLTTGDAGANDHTFDIGFTTGLSLGNLVWRDLNNNGLFDTGEAGIDGVAVRLYDGTGAELASTSTSGGGLYLFSGLAPGDYYVAITPPDGACSSTGTPGSATGPYEGTPGSQPPDPDTVATDSDDNGYGVGTCGAPTYVIRSSLVTLTVGGEPISEDGNANSNLTVDFGLIGTLSLGNLVWLDANNDGLVSGGEAGLSGVTVNLLSSAGAQLATTTTNASGLYSFTNLVAGDYIVEVVPAAGYCSRPAPPLPPDPTRERPAPSRQIPTPTPTTTTTAQAQSLAARPATPSARPPSPSRPALNRPTTATPMPTPT
ncbi:MAG TPA: SdrD B-like domain-containing protein, partial [Anaerolineales bacterium]|nr:SdrD B-like domain-containing protein [Anaerolineales bacterium]